MKFSIKDFFSKCDQIRITWIVSYRTSAESFIQQVSQLKSKDKKIHKIKYTCENLLLIITRIKCNAKKMQQRKKSKRGTLKTKLLMIRTLEIRGISAVNHQKKNGLIKIKAAGKEKEIYLCISMTL